MGDRIKPILGAAGITLVLNYIGVTYFFDPLSTIFPSYLIVRATGPSQEPLSETRYSFFLFPYPNQLQEYPS